VVDASFNPIDRSALGLNDRVPVGKRIVRGGITTIIGNAWSVVVGVVTLPILLRGLGPAQFGLWVLLQTLSAVNGWLSLADLGLRAAVVRELAHALGRGDHDDADSIAGTAFRMYVSLAVLVAIALVLAGSGSLATWFSAPPNLVDALRLASVWFAIQVGAELLLVAAQSLLEGSQRVDVARALHALRATATAFAAAIAATNSGRLPTVAVASAVATVIVTALAWLVTFRVTATRPRGWDASRAVSLARYGAQIGAINATGVLHRMMDRIVVGAIYGPAAVALVEIATQIANGVSIALSVAHPLTSTASWIDGRGDREARRGLLIRGTKFTVLATIPAAAVAAILAPNIVAVWMGDRWADAGGITTLAVVGVALAAPSQAASLLLQASGRARAVLVPALVAVTANLVLTVWLARSFGIAGVFWATIVTASFLGVPITRHALRLTETSCVALVRGAFLPAAIPAVAAFGAAAVGSLADGELGALVLGTLCVSIAWLATTWHFGLDRSDRAVSRAALSPQH
jgi:O-antigen/teichoic acid export membrane protein